jgi:hypothetical protein
MSWESLGGRLESAPAVTSWAANEMQVFAIHADGALWNRYWDGDRWHDWESLGGVFARGRDGSLQHCWYEPGGWTGWESLGGELASDPTACSWGPGRLDVFARGPQGDLLHGWWEDGRWSWEV